jgi:hypothetical protein
MPQPAWLLTQTVTMPLWGRFSDLYGRRPIFLTGLTTFLLGSALSGASQNMGQLIVFRMVQGLGAGALMTLGYTIIGELFGLERRARMQGYISSVWGVASLIGPWVGGMLTDYVSWRWVFYINLPIGAIAMAVLAVTLRGLPRPARRPVVDWAGVALFAAGVSAILLGIVEAGRVGHVAVGRAVAGGAARAARGVDHREVEQARGDGLVELQLVGQLQQELEALVDDLGAARVGPVGLVDHQHDGQARHERLAEHEAGLRQGAFAGVDQQEHPVDHGQSALDLTVLFNGFKPLFAALSPKDVNELSGEIISVLQGEGAIKPIGQHYYANSTFVDGRNIAALSSNPPGLFPRVSVTLRHFAV